MIRFAWHPAHQRQKAMNNRADTFWKSYQKLLAEFDPFLGGDDAIAKNLHKKADEYHRAICAAADEQFRLAYDEVYGMKNDPKVGYERAFFNHEPPTWNCRWCGAYVTEDNRQTHYDRHKQELPHKYYSISKEREWRAVWIARG